MTRVHRGFLPPYLLRRLAESEGGGGFAGRTLAADQRLRSGRAEGRPVTAPRGAFDVGQFDASRVGADQLDDTAAPAADPAWIVYTANNAEILPGDRVRAAGDPGSGDAAVDEAATGVTAALALFEEVYGRDSYDGSGRQVTLSVHYGQDYVNAFWDGNQLVFGDGDGEVFERFTKPLDVLAHELSHAVVEYTAGLVYQDQPGALNESVCDAFAAATKQRVLGQQAAEGDWLIGAGLFTSKVGARALRDMAAPGTAYDDPQVGSDPQVGHMRDYVETADDNGGVHLNSGIPNKAFQLAAIAIGGTTWEGAGRIWYAALEGDAVGPDTDFVGFAEATVDAAGEHAEAVRGAWRDVGVAVSATDQGGTRGNPQQVPPGQPGGPPRRRVRVRRSGGFTGQAVESEWDLAAADRDPASMELAELVGRVDPTSFRTASSPQPDRFSYEFDLDGSTMTVPEQDLTDDLRRIATIVLSRGEM